MKINLKAILAAVPAAFMIVKESVTLWRSRERSCEKCEYWAKKIYHGADADCGNAYFNASVNAVFTKNGEDILELAGGEVPYMMVLVNRTFCCKHFKRKKG